MSLLVQAASYLGNYALSSIVYFKFSITDATGVLTTLGGSPVVKVYKDAGTTESTAGVTLTVDFDNRTGMCQVAIDTSSDGTFYAAGHEFEAVLTAGTVGLVSVAGTPVGHFSLLNRVVNLAERDPQIRYITVALEGLAVPTAYENADVLLKRLWDAVAFGSTGLVTTNYSAWHDEAYALVVQTDGKLVAAGKVSVAQFDWDFGLVRYKVDGTVDTSFGTAGVATVGFGTSDDELFALALQDDGKLLAGGMSFTGEAASDFALARLAANGALDTSFGTGGKVVTDLGTDDDRVQALLIQSDGKIVAVGMTDTADSNTYEFALVRYETDGTVDTSFGTSGIVRTHFESSFNDKAWAAALQADGMVVAAGEAKVSGAKDFGLVRYATDGSLDTAFGSGGKVSTDMGGDSDQARAVLILPDGKIVAGGRGESGGNPAFALVRYNTDGSLDLTFGSGGKVITPPLGLGDQLYALALQPDGKIMAAGSFTNSSSSDGDGLFVRYHANGVLDNTFGVNGRRTVSLGSTGDVLRALVLQPDGKAVAAGQMTVSGSNTAFALARLTPSGILDKAASARSLLDPVLSKLEDLDVSAGAVTLASAGLDAVLVDGKTLPVALQIIAALVAGKLSGAGTSTEVFKGLDGTTTRASMTVDASGNRTGASYP